MSSIETVTKDPAKIYVSKVKDKVILLDNPLKTSEEKKKRIKLQKKKKIKVMNARERKETKVYEIPKECHK